MSVERDFDLIKQRLGDPAFLEMRGLGNEVPIFIHCYDPADELKVRTMVRKLAASNLPCNLHVVSLWDTFLKICEENRIMGGLMRKERRKGKDALLEQIENRSAPPEAYIRAMDWPEHKTGDVLLIHDVGRVYPFTRAHSILNNGQKTFGDIPVIMLYPGVYTGQELVMFGVSHERNYYRAFTLLGASDEE